MLVIGLDGATWKVIQPNLENLPNIKRLIREGKAATVIVKGKPLSVPLWCSIFSGKTPEEHGHEGFMINDQLLHRDDIHLDFIWDTLAKKGYKVFALNIPFVLPPYSFRVQYKPVGYGLPETEEEWSEELEEVTKCARKILEQKPDLLCVVYTLLDRVQHYYWGEKEVAEWYQRVDVKIGELLKYDTKVIVLSDHGFCDFNEAKIKTLKRAVMNGRAVKGDHHEEAVIITKNIFMPIKESEDVYYAIQNEFKV